MPNLSARLGQSLVMQGSQGLTSSPTCVPDTHLHRRTLLILIVGIRQLISMTVQIILELAGSAGKGTDS